MGRPLGSKNRKPRKRKSAFTWYTQSEKDFMMAARLKGRSFQWIADHLKPKASKGAVQRFCKTLGIEPQDGRGDGRTTRVGRPENRPAVMISKHGVEIKLWTPDDDAKLMDCLKHGEAWPEIAATMGRTEGAMKARIRWLKNRQTQP